MKMHKNMTSANKGALMSGFDIEHDKHTDKLSYPGAYTTYNDVYGSVMKQRLKDKKLPGYLTAGAAMQKEIDDYINNHPKASLIKKDIAFNEKRKKEYDVKALNVAPLGAALGFTAPIGAAGLLEAALNSKNGERFKSAVRGAKTMLPSSTNLKGVKSLAELQVPLLGAGIGITSGAMIAHHLNEKYRDKKVGKKRVDTLNDISYDLDRHMREKDTIKRIADNSTFKNMLNKKACNMDNSFEKEAGYKRDLRIARAEAKAKNPRLLSTSVYSPGNIKKYKEEMAEYGNAIESFLNSKDRNQDWATKRKMAGLSIMQGESSKDVLPTTSTKSFVNKRIIDKHSKGNLNLDDLPFGVPVREDLLSNHPNYHAQRNQNPAMSPKRTKQIHKKITMKDSNLKKQLQSGIHKQKIYSIQDLKADGVYFKAHSGEDPFNIAGSAGRYIKRDFTGNPKMPKKGIPIWASKLPEVSTTYGDTVLAFKPNEAMIAGASPIDHRHLAKDTRHMTEKQIKLTNGWNQSFDLNRNPEYERVFTYDKKNMDKSTVATYKKHKIAPGGRFDHDAYVFTKNKPGSLADAYARKVVNGPQKAYGLSAKETKRLDRKAMLRYYDSIKDIENPTPFELSSQKDIHNTLTNINKARKDTAFRNNMAKALGAGALAGLAGYGAYKGIKKIKDKRDYIKSREEQEMANNEKKANEVHYELQIEKQALK